MTKEYGIKILRENLSEEMQKALSCGLQTNFDSQAWEIKFSDGGKLSGVKLLYYSGRSGEDVNKKRFAMLTFSWFWDKKGERKLIPC